MYFIEHVIFKSTNYCKKEELIIFKYFWCNIQVSLKNLKNLLK